MYGYVVNFNKYSSNLMGGLTLEEARTKAQEAVAYHKEYTNVRSAYIDKACDHCKGEKSVVERVRKTKRFHRVICPVCQGAENQIVEVLDV